VYTPGDYCFTYGDGKFQEVWTENGGQFAVSGLFRTLHNTFVKNGIPVLIGEFAAGAKHNEADRAQWAAYMMEQCDREGIPAVWWDNGGKEPVTADDYVEMGLLDRNTNTWLYPQIVEALTGVRVENVHP